MVNEHVVPARLKRPPGLIGKLVAEMSSGAVPVLVTLSTAVLAPAVNTSVRTPKTVTSVPPVAPVKLSVPVPCATPLPVSVTGVGVTTVPSV